MSCKLSECSDTKYNTCCFECKDFKECDNKCLTCKIKNNGIDKENYKNKCVYYDNEEIWSWNEIDDENWSHGTFDSREEAIEDALGSIDDNATTIYIGRCEYVPLPTNIDSEKIFWDLDEKYCDETGCEEYIFEGVTEEQTKWLEDKLSELMLEFYARIGLKSNWFTVVEQEEIDLCEYEKEKK